MKTSRLWAHVRHYLLLLGVVCAGLSVASSAGAQQNEYPSSQASGSFSKWRKMNPSMFDVGSIALLEQCQTAEPTKDWLGPVHCKRLIEAKEEGRYEVVWIDGKKLDILLGRVDSDPDKNARVHHYQEMQLGRLARALFFDLGDGVYSYWFTGEQGKSCNNLAFVFIAKRKPVSHTSEVVEVIAEKQCHFVPDGQVVTPGVYTHLNGVAVCDTFIPGFSGVTPSNVQSSSRLVCE